jgi:YVTN family beta-propeller protein
VQARKSGLKKFISKRPARRAWGCGFLYALLLGGGAATAATPIPCTLTLTAPLVIALPDSHGGLVFDSLCQHLYVTDTSANVVQVVNLISGNLATPISVGTGPWGLDLSPDGQTLYVANRTANSLSVVDVAQGVETARIIVPPDFANDSPLSVAVNAAGKVFFSTTFAGSGFGGRMMEYDPVTSTVQQRKDFYSGGTTTEATYLAPSADRNAIGVVAGDISSGPVFVYSTSTDTFSHERDIDSFVGYVAVDGSGSTLLVDPNGYVFDASLSLNGALSDLGLGVAIDPASAVGYQVSGATINVLDLKQISVTKTIPLGDTTSIGSFFNSVGRLAISPDGTLLAAITDHGIAIVPTGVVRVVPFASFTATADLHMESAAGRDSFDLDGKFTLGAASTALPTGSPSLQLIVGSVSLSLPAGALTATGRGYEFHGPVSGGRLHLQIEQYGHGPYTLFAQGSGFDFTGTVLPVPVALVIGTDAGRTQLARGEAQLSSHAIEFRDVRAAGGNFSAVAHPRRNGVDRQGNLLSPAASPATSCTYAKGSVGSGPRSPGANCTTH